MQFPCDIACQPAQQRAAAGQQHAGGGYIRCQFGRGAFQHIAGGSGNAGGQLLHRLIEIAGVDNAAGRQVRLPRMTAHLHNTLKFAFSAAGHLLFQLLGSQRADGDLEFFLHILGDAVVKGVARHRQAGRLDPAAHADDSNIGGAAADVHDHAAVRLAYLQTGTERSGHRLIYQKDLPGPCRHDGFHHSVRFNAGDCGRYADGDARLEEAGAADLVDKPHDQLICHAVVLYNAVTQRAHKVDMGGRAAHHLQCGVPHCNDGVGAGVHRADGRLAENHTLLLGRNDDRGRAQINSDVVLFHGSFSIAKLVLPLSAGVAASFKR